MARPNFTVTHENNFGKSKEPSKFSNSYSAYLNSTKWIINSSATKHMTACLNLLLNAKFDRNFIVQIANGSVMNLVGYGSIRLNGNIVIHNILFVLDCKTNLLLVRKLATDVDYYIIFGNNKVILLDSISQMKIDE